MPVSELRTASTENATRCRPIEDGPLDLAPLLAAGAAGVAARLPRLERPGYRPADTVPPRGGFTALLAQVEAGAWWFKDLRRR